MIPEGTHNCPSHEITNRVIFISAMHKRSVSESLSVMDDNRCITRNWNNLPYIRKCKGNLGRTNTIDLGDQFQPTQVPWDFYAQSTYNCNQCKFAEICKPTLKHSRSSPTYKGRKYSSCELKSKEVVIKVRRQAIVFELKPRMLIYTALVRTEGTYVALMRRESLHVVNLCATHVRCHAQEVGTLTDCQLFILPGTANPYLYLG